MRRGASLRRSARARELNRCPVDRDRHLGPIGSFEGVNKRLDKLIDNATTLISSVIKAKPSVAKGKYIKACYLSSSMGPGIALDTTPIEVAAKA